ncbi:MAG: TrkH family potassium uptake protein [Actinomycetota bacterium]
MTRGSRRGTATPTALSDAPRGRPNTALHVTGIALSFVAVGMAVTAVVEATSTNVDTGALVISTVVCGSLGALLWFTTRVGDVRARDVFAAVGWAWVSVAVVGSLPFILAGTFVSPDADLADRIVNSLFESTSGFTATGSTVLDDFSGHGRGLMLYRQAMQWYGGMGIVVLAVTVLPFLGVGGLDLMTAEAPGPSSERLAPRVSETARQLWIIYVVFTLVVMAALFVVPGPSLYDSVAHGLTTASTGGFSPYASSIGHFDSLAVEIVIIVAMIYGGVNFSLHWRAARGEISAYTKDSETRTFFTILSVAIAIVVVITTLDTADQVDGIAEALRAVVFTVVALGTSTGFTNATEPGAAADYVHWASGAQIVILFLFVMGGSTGSTTGGIKVMRVQVLFSHTIRSIRRTQQPRAVLPVKHGRFAVAEDIVSRMAGFFLLYVLLVGVGAVILTVLGSDLENSVGAVISTLGNMGPALGDAGPTGNFDGAFSAPARLVLAVFMLIGRLEIFPILLMFAAPYRAARDVVRR